MSGDDLLEMYIFADKIQSCKLMNFTMDTIQDHLRDTCTGIGKTPDMMKRVFQLTINPASPIRHLCAGLISQEILNKFCCWKKNDVAEFLKQTPEALDLFIEFQAKFAARQLFVRGDDSKRKKSGFPTCFFHVHDNDDEVCESEPNF